MVQPSVEPGPPGLVLLDCDGVLVDNTAFDRNVTLLLVERLASNRRIDIDEAEKVWARELASTRPHWRWYDYSFHCKNLGLSRADQIVHEVHLESAELLGEISGVSETLEALTLNGYTVAVATDATAWVARFKLDRMGIKLAGKVFASDTVEATKATAGYWHRVARARVDGPAKVLVDNRIENLRQARDVLGVQTIRFEWHEHVTTLSPSVAPVRHRIDHRSTASVAGHEELRWALQEALPRFSLSA